MKTLELAPKTWKRFFERLNDLGTGPELTIQTSESSSAETKEIAAREPLREITFCENPGQCSNQLRINAGQTNGKSVELTVVEPVRILLKNGQNDRYNQIQILAESGTTILDLNPGLPNDVIQGLAE